MNQDNLAAVVTAHLGPLRDGVVAGLTHSLKMTSAFVPPSVPPNDPDDDWPRKDDSVVVFVDMKHPFHGLSNHLRVTTREIESNKIKLPALFRMKGEQVGHEMFNLVMRHGGQMLQWQRAGRWKRLRWAWRGVIPETDDGD